MSTPCTAGIVLWASGMLKCIWNDDIPGLVVPKNVLFLPLTSSGIRNVRPITSNRFKDKWSFVFLREYLKPMTDKLPYASFPTMFADWQQLSPEEIDLTLLSRRSTI